MKRLSHWTSSLFPARRRRNSSPHCCGSESLEQRIVLAAGALAGLELTALAAIATDDLGQPIGELNADERRAMASTTKIMTNLLAIELTAAGNPDGISRDDLVTAGWYPARVGGSTTNGTAAPADPGTGNSDLPLVGIRVGEVFTLDGLINLSLLSSDNEATQVIAEYLISQTAAGQALVEQALDEFQAINPSVGFTQSEIAGEISFDLNSGIVINNAFAMMMNQRAADMGLVDTQFRNPHGRDPGTVTGIKDYPQPDSRNNGHYTTARELSELGRQAMLNADFAGYVGTRDAVDVASTLADGTDNNRPGIVSGNRLVRPNSSHAYPGATGVKTGMTAAAGFALVSQSTILGRTVNAVVLKSEELNDRFTDSIQVLNYGFLNRYGFVVDQVAKTVNTRTATYDFATRTLTVHGSEEADLISIYRFATDMYITVNGVSEFLPFAELSQLVVDSGAGDDSIVLSGTPENLPIVVLAGEGKDTVRLGTTLGLGLFQNHVQVDGGTSGTDEDLLILEDLGASSGQNYGITADHVTRDGSVLADFSGIERLHVKGTNHADTFSLSMVSGIEVTLLGRFGIDRIVGPNLNTTWTISGLDSGTIQDVVFTNVESLQGGSSKDQFVMLPGASLFGHIDGGNGHDTLDYSSYGSSVTVSLAAGTATGVGGQIESIEHVTGSTRDDVIIGDHRNNILDGHGGNDILAGLQGDDELIGKKGRSILIGGDGRDTLKGGDGQDILIGGSTAWDHNSTALQAVMAVWKDTRVSFDERIGRLSRGVTVGGVLIRLAANLIDEDDDMDKLFGGGDLDWILGSALDKSDEK